ncbi:Gfo/Idh/MocA family protein [Aegicerativicinus sediminis]
MSTRRSFIKTTGLALVASSLPLYGLYKSNRQRKLGVALVGLGYYSTDLLAPALQLTQHCELKGIVTGSPDKIPFWQEKYGIKDSNVYNYENMHQIADNNEIDVVYIVLPNSLHKKYTIIGAEAGKHVWCEKPMAMDEEECREMIKSCNKNKRKLTIGYRMQHEPVTQTIISWNKKKPYGSISSIYAEAGFSMGSQNPEHWKKHKKLGGGAMFDMGVYPLNAVRYTTGLEPISVSAKQKIIREDLFTADEITTFDLEFPGGIKASCRTSFAENRNILDVKCTKGWFKVQPFQSYRGVKATASDGKNISAYQGNQQAKQMDEDALAIINNTEVVVPGEEGLRDIIIVDAIRKSASNNGNIVKLG